LIVNAAPPLDSRDSAAIFKELWRRRYGYVPEWVPPAGSAGVAISEIFARYVYSILQRLNQTPLKNKLAFLDFVGLRLIPASQARAPIVFQLTPQATDSLAPIGTKVAAPPPPGSSNQIVFETERETGIAAANLVEVFSLWPGRDEYIDHSADYLAKTPFTIFDSTKLQPTPHVLYLAHSIALSFAGSAHLEVQFELEQGSSSPLDILWQYWDGGVWRGFRPLTTSCLVAAEKGSDGTNGLMYSGSVRLDTDCAKTALQTVNGVESYWIRGHLTQPLPPDPTELLPVVDSMRVRTTIEQDFEATLLISVQPGTLMQVALTNEGGRPLEEITVTITSDDDANYVGGVNQTTASDGTLLLPSAILVGKTYRFDVAYLDLQLSATYKYTGGVSDAQINLTLVVSGLRLDGAVIDSQKADVTKPFFPFGQQPQPGATFYFNQQEVFSRVGSSVRVYLSRTQTPQDQFQISDSSSPTKLDHFVSWEYWNGFNWVVLPIVSETDSPNPGDMDDPDVIDFDIPADFCSTQVNNQDGLWIRVRLMSGGFGFTKEVDFKDGAGNDNKFVYVITVAPALSDFRLAYAWKTPVVPLEQVFTHNDFQFEDHTDDSRWPGTTFSPYKAISEVPPALYLGFDQPLPVSDIGIYFDLVEDSEDVPPSLVWEYFNGAGWRKLTIQDDTRSLHLPGIVSLIASDDSVAIPRFDTPLHWVRARLSEDGPPDQITVHSIFLNATWASQRQTYSNVPLGTSTGLPNQVFTVTQIPVLEGEILEVRESSGARANVEWRTFALELNNGGTNLLNALEAQLAAEGPQTELIAGALRLIRDRLKRVTEVWVCWQNQQNLFSSGPADRHYVLEGAQGRVIFGDGSAGTIPSASSAIQLRQFQSGGGLFGNVAALTIKQLLGSIGGVQAVFNPRAAEGGADGESLQTFAGRAPESIRHRGRALTPPDYEAMAHEASAGVAVARAIPGRDNSGQTRPGWVTIVIIPRSADPQPIPSFGLREEVRTYLEQRAPAGLAEAQSIVVAGPDYLPIDVDATLAPKDASQAGTVEEAARAAIEAFLNPLTGGPRGQGWDLGRGLFLSDLAGAFAKVPGIDYVDDLSLRVNGALQGNQVDVRPEQIIVAGQLRLKLI
jgi:uncharacterized phage protein gp47/JayE